MQSNDAADELYESDNENLPLFQVCAIGSTSVSNPTDVLLSNRTLNLLSRCCKSFYYVIAPVMQRMAVIRNKWVGVFANRLSGYLMRRSFPIKFTGSMTKTIATRDMNFNNRGICPLDVNYEIFNDVEKDRHYAFADISFRLISPISCILVMFMDEQHLMSFEIAEESYIDTGNITIAVANEYNRRYGSMNNWPGQYVLNLRLPTQNNPFVYGMQNQDPSKISFCFARQYDLYTDRVQIAPDQNFMLGYITHAVVKFKSIECMMLANREFMSHIDPRVNIGLYLTPILKEKLMF